jgi:hypothetical protein
MLLAREGLMKNKKIVLKHTGFEVKYDKDTVHKNMNKYATMFKSFANTSKTPKTTKTEEEKTK